MNSYNPLPEDPPRTIAPLPKRLFCLWRDLCWPAWRFSVTLVFSCFGGFSSPGLKLWQKRQGQRNLGHFGVSFLFHPKLQTRQLSHRNAKAAGWVDHEVWCFWSYPKRHAATKAQDRHFTSNLVPQDLVGKNSVVELKRWSNLSITPPASRIMQYGCLASVVPMATGGWSFNDWWIFKIH